MLQKIDSNLHLPPNNLHLLKIVGFLQVDIMKKKTIFTKKLRCKKFFLSRKENFFIESEKKNVYLI